MPVIATDFPDDSEDQPRKERLGEIFLEQLRDPRLVESIASALKSNQREQFIREVYAADRRAWSKVARPDQSRGVPKVGRSSY